MTRYVEFLLSDNSKIIIKSNEPEPDTGIVKSGVVSDVIEKANETFAEATKKVSKVAIEALNTVRSELPETPDEIEISFGLQASGELKTLVLATGMETNVSVTLKWNKGSTS